MTELGERLLAALRAQGYGVMFTAEDVVVTHDRLPRIHHIPRFTFYMDGELGVVLVALAVTGLIEYMGFVPVQLEPPGPEGDRN